MGDEWFLDGFKVHKSAYSSNSLIFWGIRNRSIPKKLLNRDPLGFHALALLSKGLAFQHVLKHPYVQNKITEMHEGFLVYDAAKKSMCHMH